MSKKKPITVTLTKGRHKTQPWTFSIDDIGPGPQVTVKERYTRKSTAKLDALGKLGIPNFYPKGCGYLHEKTGRPIVFVTKPSTKKK